MAATTAPSPVVERAAEDRAARRRAFADRLPRLALGAFAVFAFAFLYEPAFVIIVFSFNSSAIMSWPLDGLTLDWWREAFSDHEMLGGLQNSLMVAVTSTGIALALGLPAGIALDRFVIPGRGVFERLLMAPFLFPGVISGVALVSLFLEFGVSLSLGTVIIGHTTMLLGVVVILTLITLRRWDRSLEQAAMDLGASEVRAFITVTLPMVIQSKLHLQITPEVNAMAAAVLVTSLVALGVISRLFRTVATER
jgi:spermidine/putrescine transport system permease protein